MANETARVDAEFSSEGGEGDWDLGSQEASDCEEELTPASRKHSLFDANNEAAESPKQERATPPATTQSTEDLDDAYTATAGWTCMHCRKFVSAKKMVVDHCPFCKATREESWTCQKCTFQNRVFQPIVRAGSPAGNRAIDIPAELIEMCYNEAGEPVPVRPCDVLTEIEVYGAPVMVPKPKAAATSTTDKKTAAEPVEFVPVNKCEMCDAERPVVNVHRGKMFKPLDLTMAFDWVARLKV